MQDRYGEYYSFTGHEAPSRCFWCGIEVKKHRRYCCKEHHTFYLEHFHWFEASNACLKRQWTICGDCCERHFLVVHHIEPLNGTPRIWNILNQPKNLIGLCPPCHGKRHTELNRQKNCVVADKGSRQGAFEFDKPFNYPLLRSKSFNYPLPHAPISP